MRHRPHHPVRRRRRSTRQIAAEVKNFDPAPAFPSPKEIRRTDRFAQFGVYGRASGAASIPAWISNKANRDEIGVFIGSGIGGLYTTEEQHKVLLNKGPGRLSPFMIPMLILNMASGLFSMYYKLRGPNVATCSACATATHAIGEAWRTIKMGDAKVMFAGGSEATIVPIGIGGFCAMKAMSTRNDDPQTRFAPVRQGSRRLRHGRRRGRDRAGGTRTRQSARRAHLLRTRSATATRPTPIT